MTGRVGEPVLTIHRTRGAGAARRQTITEKVHREMHGAVIRATDAKKTRRCTHGLYDHRRGRRRAWTAMLRVLDDMIAVGVPEQRIQSVVNVLHWYVTERVAERAGSTTTPRAA